MTKLSVLAQRALLLALIVILSAIVTVRIMSPKDDTLVTAKSSLNRGNSIPSVTSGPLLGPSSGSSGSSLHSQVESDVPSVVNQSNSTISLRDWIGWGKTVSEVKQNLGPFTLQLGGTIFSDKAGNMILQPQGNILLTRSVNQIPNIVTNRVESTPSVRRSTDDHSSSPSQSKNVKEPIKQYETIASEKKPHRETMAKVTPLKTMRQQDPATLTAGWTSPQQGTDIASNPEQLITMFNQSRVLYPKLQLNQNFKVYLCRHADNGIRFFFLAREGLLLHPRIQLVDNPKDAEIIVYLPVSSPWQNTECNNPLFRNRTIVLDEGDGAGLFDLGSLATMLLYFKRSFVSRHRGVFQGYMEYVKRGDVFPMTYPTGEAYLRTTYNSFSERDIEILCTLRGSNHDPVRQRVREWVEEYVKARGVKNAIAGQINHDSRRTISKAYFENMYKAKIIVTSNPSGWEGDFRFCEALSSGALIFIDKMMVPRPQPFINNQHVVYYDNMNKTDLFEKLDNYRYHQDQARKIAMQGYLHAMKYHRAVNLIDYVFRTAHKKLIDSGKVKSASPLQYSYTETGYDILRIAQENAKKFKLHNHG